MIRTERYPEVLTLEEAAQYLRVSEAVVRHHAARRTIPGRQLGEEWRFSRAALEDWLRNPTGKEILLSQAGAFADDPEDLEQLRQTIYKDRGRPEN